MRSSIHTATARNITPNSALTVSIQGPALGSSLPSATPTSSSGAPMPSASANSASAPRKMSPVCPMTARDATSGGATHADTTSADSAPMMNVPVYVPPFCRPDAACSRLCRPAGNRNS